MDMVGEINMEADLILTNCDIITMNSSIPHAEALAIRNGKIADVGTNHKIERWIGKGTEIADLNGKTVIPSFIDAHAHMIALGHPLPWVELRGVSSIKEIQSKLQKKVRETRKGKWIQGRGWDQELLKERRYPTRWDLDKVSPYNPVILNRICGHVGVANSRALEIAKIDKEKVASLGELVGRDLRTGDLTGILREEAMEMVWNMPEPADEDLLDACSRACAEAAKAGLTSVHWVAYKPSEIYALQRLREQNRLPLRVYLMVPKEYFDDFKDKLVNDPFLKLRCVKIFSDGSLGARTAALQKPYADEPATKGILTHGLDELKMIVREANEAGFQVAAHAIGDSAVGQTIRAFRETGGKAMARRYRNRIEHASVLNPHLIRQIKELGLMVCVQPHFLISDFWVSKRLGPKRARWTYPFKSLMRSGIPVAASSDAPAEPISPLLGIWAAVTRESFPEERVSVKEALEAYTINAAYFSFEETVKGSIEVGKFADLTALSHSPFKIEPEKIKDIKVEMTIVGGKIVYSATD
jgi:predicted amidohydrolase YtcJ